MKRYKVLPVVLFFMGVTAQAQQRSPNPQGQQQGQQEGQQPDGQRRVRVDVLAGQGQDNRLVIQAFQTAVGNQVGGAWWTNTNLVARLGITDEQKVKIERAFENHRPKLESSKQLLEKEEAQLAKLLDSETIDRNAVLSQIDRVIQARGEMERANSAMTLEMREALTRTQWNQVPQPSITLGNSNVTRFTGTVTLPSPDTTAQPAGRGGAPGQRTGGGLGRGQRTGGPAQPAQPGQRQQ